MKESNFHTTAAFQAKPHNTCTLVVEKHSSQHFKKSVQYLFYGENETSFPQYVTVTCLNHILECNPYSQEHSYYEIEKTLLKTYLF